MNQTQFMIGALPTAHQPRDAIHVAVVCAVTMAAFKPGDRVEIRDGMYAYPAPQRPEHLGEAPYHGIIDPFLPQTSVEKGVWVWVLLKPNTISDMRHTWQHPDIVETMDEAEALIVLHAVAAKCSLSPEDMLDAAKQYARRGIYYGRGLDEDYKDLDANSWRQFWRAYVVLTGEDVGHVEKSYSFFTCSC